MKVLLLILLALGLVGSTVSSSADVQMLEPKWLPVYTANPEKGRVFYNHHRAEGNTIHGQMLVVYPSALVYAGKSYTSRITGVAVDCKNSAFVVVYDLYYAKSFPGLNDDSVAGVKYDTDKSSVILGNRNLIYQTFCALVV